MLTDTFTKVQSGRLDPEIHMKSTVKLEIISFIIKELPRWRDSPGRPKTDAETKLTEYLCDHLNSAAYNSITWSHIQFRTETSDETHGGRTIDLTIKPLAAVFIIEGRRHTQFDALFPIECKRLPTPKGKGRDQREYVITEPGTTGGIQRFKLGYHGAAHAFAAMIAYVQDQSSSHWLRQVNNWILDLFTKSDPIWRDSDILQLVSDDSTTGISALVSRHQRVNDLGVCEIRHLWVRMN